MRVTTNTSQSLSIIVPTLNEVDNVEQLIKRLHFSLDKYGITHEILCIDDSSDDGTIEVIRTLSNEYDFVKLIKKEGKKGKATSLLEGFSASRYPLVCMIDADLQYPPEAIGAMHEQLIDLDADVVVTERVQRKTSLLRKIQSRVFNLFFTRLLFGINYDSQSGLKLFKKSMLKTMKISPSPWSFDLEFLVRSLERQYKIISHKIVFSERASGITKTSSLSTSYELAKSSILLRFHSSYTAVRRGYNSSKQVARFQQRSAKGTFVALAVSVGLMASFLPSSTTSALSLSSTLKDTTTSLTDLLGLSNSKGQNQSNGQSSGSNRSRDNSPAKTANPQTITQPVAEATPVSPVPVAPQPTAVQPQVVASETEVTNQPQSSTQLSSVVTTTGQTAKPHDPYLSTQTSSKPTIPYIAGIYAVAAGSFTLLAALNGTRIFRYFNGRTFI